VGVSPTSTTFYLYDGWNIVAEYTNNGVEPLALTRTYTWGTDLSGSLQGAGGVGGLLAVRIHGGDHAGNYYPTFDGNGNVSEYLTDGGILKAHHEYDPFGNDVTPETAKGDLHGFFSHRFSTKPFDDISGWFYYGYRYYDPVTGRWPSRDPIGERGGINLYGFVGNDGVNKWDIYGLSPYTTFEDALDAARDELGGLTALSRFLGTIELGMAKPSILHPVDMRGSNYALFISNRSAQSSYYEGVVGVEYGTFIYCDETLGVYDYAEPTRGALPTRVEFFGSPRLYGSVGIPMTAEDPDKPKLALIHTHNMAYVTLSIDDGFVPSPNPGPPLNFPASNADRQTATTNDLPNYVVGENSFGSYSIIEIALP
jgi:RHS repeat-associated protein